MSETTLDLERLRKLTEQAQARADEQIVAECARLVGLGQATLTSRDRSQPTTRRRAVVAWILVKRIGWSQAKAARHLKRTKRQIINLLKA